MEQIGKRQSVLASDIVSLLLSKFEELPVDDRGLIVLSTLEAVSMVMAMETASYSRKNKLSKAQTEQRVDEYIKVMSFMVKRELSGHLGHD